MQASAGGGGGGGWGGSSHGGGGWGGSSHGGGGWGGSGGGGHMMMMPDMQGHEREMQSGEYSSGGGSKGSGWA